MRPHAIILPLFAFGCGLAADGGHARDRSSEPEAARDEPNDSPMNSGPELLPYSRQTDSATAHCYEARQGVQVASSPEYFVGCWQRTLVGGELLALSIADSGYFAASLDGGDYDGSDFGRWEQSDVGLVLYPRNGACALVGGVFDDACVRVFDIDNDGSAIRTAQQFAVDAITESEWVRGTGCPAIGDEFDQLAPEDVRCFPDEVEPLDVSLRKLDLNSSDEGYSSASLEFSLSPDLLYVDERDVQRNLIASVRGFELRLPDGTPAAQFLRHAQRDPNDLGEYPRAPGDFRIQSVPDRDSITVSFLHNLEELPAQVELHYEFRGAKYIKDTGPRIEVLPLRP